MKKYLINQEIYILINFIFVILIISTISLSAQVKSINKINNQRSVELEAVQTPANTFITAIMATDDSKYPIVSTIKLYRSINNGISWDSVYCIILDSIYLKNADPVLTADSAGNVYVLMMRIGIDNTIAHLWIYKSSDDGLTWQVSGKPYMGSNSADYPQITSLGNGLIFLSYTDFSSSRAPINFTFSKDCGTTWSPPKVITPNNSSRLFVGSDINWTKYNKLWITFGDYDNKSIYVTSSNDSGKTWNQVIELKNLCTYTVNKIVSSKNFDYLGVISHNPHTANSNIYYSNTLDNGKTWNTKILDKNSAYGEGAIDNNGNIHIIYNQLLNSTFNLLYVYSTDKGQTFSSPLTLFTAPNISGTVYGEYQSLIFASDDMFHLTFVDWSDTLKTKQIIFSPMLTNNENYSISSDIPQVFPNPVYDILHIKYNKYIKPYNFELFNLSGESIKSGSISGDLMHLNMSDIMPGNYILRLVCDNRIFVIKLIKI